MTETDTSNMAVVELRGLQTTVIQVRDNVEELILQEQLQARTGIKDAIEAACQENTLDTEKAVFRTTRGTNVFNIGEIARRLSNSVSSKLSKTRAAESEESEE